MEDRAGEMVRQILQDQMDEILGQGKFDVDQIASEGEAGIEKLLRLMEDISPLGAANAQAATDSFDMNELKAGVLRVLDQVDENKPALAAMIISTALASVACMCKGVEPDFNVIGAIAALGWRAMCKKAKEFKEIV